MFEKGRLSDFSLYRQASGRQPLYYAQRSLPLAAVGTVSSLRAAELSTVGSRMLRADASPSLTVRQRDFLRTSLPTTQKQFSKSIHEPPPSSYKNLNVRI